MKRSTLVVVLAVALLVVTPGCALLRALFGSFKRPAVNFVNAELQNVSFTQATVNLNYDVDNPNGLDLEIATIEYQLFIEDRPLASGRPPNGFSLPANQKTRLAFPAQVKFTDVFPVAEVLLNKDTARYRAQGTLGVKSPIGLLTFPLQKEGDFEVPKVPAMTFGNPRIHKLNFGAASLEIPVTFTNRNTFALPLTALSGRINISGAEIGSVNASQLQTLAPKGSQTVTIPLDVNLLNAMSAANALRSGRGELSFTGQLGPPGQSVPVNFKRSVQFER
jgi:LEA14-like dessication related protein